MKLISERTDEELAKRLSMSSSEYSESGTPPKAEVLGGEPGPKTPEEIKQNPHELINQEAVDEMGAKHNLAFDPNKGKEWWDSVTEGKTHKITACMEAAKSFADDPGAFCKSLADDVGYDPNAQ